jgi:DEAD/DEAH box helicase domain-containing protein
VKRYTHETLAWAPIELPEQTLNTAGFWLSVPMELAAVLRENGILPPPVDYGPNWISQRDQARARDGHRCSRCGASASTGSQLDVHHITPFRSFGYRPGENQNYLLANRLENLVTLCARCHRQVGRAQGERGALSGLGYVMRALAPLYVMCAPGDLGAAVEMHPRSTRLPTVTLYDQAPGGAGLSPRLYDMRDDLLCAARETVGGCACEDGCPGCVGPVIGAERRVKELTTQLIDALLGVDLTV